jgi:hypothetical protein
VASQDRADFTSISRIDFFASAGSARVSFGAEGDALTALHTILSKCQGAGAGAATVRCVCFCPTQRLRHFNIDVYLRQLRVSAVRIFVEIGAKHVRISTVLDAVPKSELTLRNLFIRGNTA